jgi:formylglycine-generating enzyme required for sulfatase activity
LAAPSFGGTVTFGSGANAFDMTFVTIGNPGNAADTTGNPNPAGAVDYEYGIGKFEVSRDMITKYNADFGTANSLEITLWDMEAEGFVDGNLANKPATGISWNEAARFVNWLNTSTGGVAAYKFTTSGVNDFNALWTSSDAGYDPNNKFRNSLAKYVLPSPDEWYKAAYFSPGGTYYDYATGSDTAPSSVPFGTLDNTAVYNQTGDVGPADVDKAGGLSRYGVMGLGGNVYEWDERDAVSSGGSDQSRGWRGGAFDSNLNPLKSSFKPNRADGSSQTYVDGFRVVMLSSDPPPAVPEPSMMVIGTLFGLGGLVAKRRRKK